MKRTVMVDIGATGKMGDTSSSQYIQNLFDMNKDRIVEFCQRHHIKKLAIFGSVLTEQFGPESDIDILVEFEPGYRVGFIRLAGMELELSGLFGRKADMRTPADLSRYFRNDIIEIAEVIYDTQ